MRRTPALDQTKSFLSRCRDIDAVWILNIFNEEIKQYKDVRRTDVDMLNRLDKFSDIKKEIMAELCHLHDRDIEHFIYCLEEYQAHISMPKIDLKNIENNKRFILFANNTMQNNLRSRILEDIINPVYKFFYMLFTYEEYFNRPRSLEEIYKRFSNVHMKFDSHFNFAENDFYIWDNSQIYKSEEYKRLRVNLLNSTNPEININSIFDQLYDLDINVHYALRKKISNAWYQKRHRDDKKVKKPGFYALTVKAKEALASLARKKNLSEDKVLEELINQAYVKECNPLTGEFPY